MEEEKKVSLQKGTSPVSLEKESVEETEQIEVEVVDSFIVEDAHGTHQAFSQSMSSAMGEEFVPVMDKSVPVGIKWLIGLFVVFTGYIGTVTGIMIGLCFMKSPYPRSARYGKNLIIACVIYLIVCILLSFLGGILGIVFRILGSILELIFSG